MSPGKNRLYRFEVGEWEKACKRLGRKHDDEARRALHIKCGAPASSADFTEDDLKAVLKELRSFSQMENLAAQMGDDPREDAMNRAWLAVAVIVTAARRPGQSLHDARKAYIEGTCRRMFHVGTDEATTYQLQQTMGVLEKSAARKESKASTDVPVGENPF
jgi:hypothetical protein